MKKFLTVSTTFALALGMSAFAADMNAFVRVVHAVPDAPAVDVYVDGTRTVNNAPFKAVTPYGDVPAGKHRVVITAAGDMNARVFEGDVTFRAGKYYTVAAIGYLKNLKPKIFTANSLNMDKEKAQVNVFHLSPNGPRVDAIAPDYDNARIVPNLSYGRMYKAMVSPMGVNLNIVPAMKTTTVVKNLSGINVNAGKTYSVFAVGLVGGTGTQAFDLIATEDKVVMGSMSGK